MFAGLQLENHYKGWIYISSAVAQAFEDLVDVVVRLGDKGMGLTWAKKQKEVLKMAQRYLKTDFKG